MDETQLFPRKIVFGEVDVTQGGQVDRNIFDELVVAMIDWKKYRYVSVGETSYGPYFQPLKIMLFVVLLTHLSPILRHLL